MRILARTLAALLLGALAIFAAGLPASAQTETCTEETPGYPASGVCSVTVHKAAAVCLDGVTSLTYEVSTAPDTASTIDLHWLNPAGPNYVQTGQPLAATVGWPSSIPKVTVDVQFVSGTTTATVSVSPVDVNGTCRTSRVLAVSDGTTSSRVLAATGAEVLPFVVVGGGLLLIGAALLVTRAARNRHIDAEQ